MNCEKCGYEGEGNRQIGLLGRELFLCEVCKNFIPEREEEISNYLQERIDWKILETFRKSGKRKITTVGMEKKARGGSVVSRAAYGYKIENGELIINEEEKLIVQKIFLEFLESNISLNRLSKKYGFSLNGLKKILRNFTYLGKVKFAGQISAGKHSAIIHPELFNRVQKKLEEMRIK
ncbi:recombinase family protein [Candidatus Pacearchaeota archaeon]|nr:recombinase family protein [Candidatus Pacearchaeota archaeon]